MKKVSLLALALTTTLAATAASAQTAMPVAPAAPCAVPCPCPKAFQGFSFGADLGYGFAASNLVTTINTATFASKSAMQGLDGGLMVGYLQRFNNWGLGLDFIANWSNTSSTNNFQGPATNNINGVKVQMRNALDLRGVVGYVINNLVMPKVYLGWENAQYKVSSVASTGNDLNGLNASKRLNGFLWGFGVDFLVAKNVVCGFEYTGVTFGKQTFPINKGAPSNAVSIRPGAYNRIAFTAKFVY